MGADIVCLLRPTPVETILSRDIEPGGWLIVSSESAPLISPDNDVRICLIETGDEVTLPSYDVHIRMHNVNGELHVTGSEIAEVTTGIPETADYLEYATMFCLGHVLPGIVSRYYPGS